MEKRRQHHDLDNFKKLFCDTKNRYITKVALQGAARMGYMNEEDIEAVINKLQPLGFYKSMTSHHNNKIWQDVYKFKDGENNLYIKLQLSFDKQDTVLIQLSLLQKSYMYK